MVERRGIRKANLANRASAYKVCFEANRLVRGHGGGDNSLIALDLSAYRPAVQLNIQVNAGEAPGEAPGEAKGEAPGEAPGEAKGEAPGEAPGEADGKSHIYQRVD